MVRVTRQAHKAGTTDFVATVYALRRLDDPDAEGNGGGIGFDDETFSQVAPTEPLAKAAALRLAKKALREDPRLVIGDANVTERDWVGEAFFDERFGQIRDAYQRDRWTRVGYWDDETGSYKWVAERWRA